MTLLTYVSQSIFRHWRPAAPPDPHDQQLSPSGGDLHGLARPGERDRAMDAMAKIVKLTMKLLLRQPLKARH